MESSSRFSGDSDHTVAVHTIGSHFIFKDHIVKPQCVNSAFSYHSVFRENINAVFRRFRIKFSGRSKLFNGAHHTVGIHAS